MCEKFWPPVFTFLHGQLFPITPMFWSDAETVGFGVLWFHKICQASICWTLSYSRWHPFDHAKTVEGEWILNIAVRQRTRKWNLINRFTNHQPKNSRGLPGGGQKGRKRWRRKGGSFFFGGGAKVVDQEQKGQAQKRRRWDSRSVRFQWQ